MTIMYALSVIAALAVFLTVLFVILGVQGALKQKNDDVLFEDKLEQMSRSELSSEDAKKKGGWFGYWEDLSDQTGRLHTDPTVPGKIALGSMAVFLGIGVLIFPGGIIGALLVPPLGALGYFFVLRREAKKRGKTLERQMEPLLSSLRSNLQSRSTPQQAIINVAGDFPSPLGDELRLVRDDMSVNVPMDQALAAFAERSSSSDIRFLVSSIQIAIESGADLDAQLETIQGIVTQRREIREKLATAVSQSMPSLWITGVFIPAGVIFSFYQDEANRTFWLSFFGLLILGAIGVLYAVGLFLSWKMVKGVENT